MDSSRLEISESEEIRLNRIINNYRNIEILHPAVARLCEVPAQKEVFHKALTHDLDLIQTRSSHLPDFEMTIYQKALMTLMKREEDLIGGIEIYVDEILGLKFFRSEDSLEMLKTAVNARDLVRSE